MFPMIVQRRSQSRGPRGPDHPRDPKELKEIKTIDRNFIWEMRDSLDLRGFQSTGRLGLIR